VAEIPVDRLLLSRQIRAAAHLVRQWWQRMAAPTRNLRHADEQSAVANPGSSWCEDELWKSGELQFACTLETSQRTRERIALV
jgi:hypothetical protein